MLSTTLVFSFCRDGRGSVNVKLWFLMVCVRCEVLCRSVLFFSTLYRDGDKEDEYQISEIIKIIAPSSSSSSSSHHHHLHHYHDTDIQARVIFVQLHVHIAAKRILAKFDSCSCCVFFVTEIIPYETRVPFGKIIVIYLLYLRNS